MLLTGTRSPSPELWLPIVTFTSWGGQDAGEATAAPVSEPQWPALSTVSGEISVPVHPKAPKVISATEGYSPGEASFPPTIAIAGDAVRARMEPAAASADRLLRRSDMKPPVGTHPRDGPAARAKKATQPPRAVRRFSRQPA